MGSSKTTQLQSSPIDLTTSFTGGESETMQLAPFDDATLILDIDAGSGTTQIDLKFQAMPEQADIYKPGDDGLEVDLFEIPVTASTNDQKRAVRIDARALNDVRMVAKSVGGTAQIKSIGVIRDGTDNPTPQLA